MAHALRPGRGQGDGAFGTGFGQDFRQTAVTLFLGLGQGGSAKQSADREEIATAGSILGGWLSSTGG